jgi:hypothetical protein
MALPRSTLAQWVGVCGVQLQPLVDALKHEILSHAVLHADETPVAMLKPGNKKTHRAYLWAYAPGAFPPRHNSCRLHRNQEHGGGDEGHQWHVTDNHSRTEL